MVDVKRAFWRGFWDGVSGGRGEMAARLWGLMIGFAGGALFGWMVSGG